MIALQFDFRTALKKALGGGLSGVAAMVLQVLLFMVSGKASQSAAALDT